MDLKNLNLEGLSLAIIKAAEKYYKVEAIKNQNGFIREEFDRELLQNVPEMDRGSFRSRNSPG